jgi:threonine dehydratase
MNEQGPYTAVAERPTTFGDVRQAAARIAGHVHRTPVLTSRSIDERLGGEVYFKCENFQRIGAFKARGAVNAVLSLDEETAARGVATHSSGNHGAALALAASLRGIPAWIVIPDDAPAVKTESVRRLGAEVVACAPGLKHREQGLERVVAETGAEVVHPYNDWRVIAGQGTAALELLEAHPGLEVLLAPVGGGGLISGSAIAAKAMHPGIAVIGCEPAGAADAKRSFDTGELQPMPEPRTIADGLRGALGTRTFAVIRTLVDDIVTVSEEDIVQAMRLVWERLKIVIEPSCAVPVAALLAGAVPLDGRRAGVILTGGNVDLDRLPWLAER